MLVDNNVLCFLFLSCVGDKERFAAVPNEFRFEKVDFCICCFGNKQLGFGLLVLINDGLYSLLLGFGFYGFEFLAPYTFIRSRSIFWYFIGKDNEIVLSIFMSVVNRALIIIEYV